MKRKPRWEDHEIDKRLVVYLQTTEGVTHDMACLMLGVTSGPMAKYEEREIDASFKRLKEQGLCVWSHKKRGWIYVKPTPRVAS